MKKRTRKGYHTVGYSNTGHVGVTETYTDRRGIRYHCFSASARPSPNRVMNKKFYFTDSASRHSALTKAVHWRQEIIAQRINEN